MHVVTFFVTIFLDFTYRRPKGDPGVAAPHMRTASITSIARRRYPYQRSLQPGKKL